MIIMRRSEDDEPRRASGEGMNRMDEILLRQQRAIHQQQQQQHQQPEGAFNPHGGGGMDDIVFRQQQLLRQEQYQGHQQHLSSNPMMHDFSMSSQGQSTMGGMPSLMEISRAEEILAAARDAITGGSSSSRHSGGASQFAGMGGEDFNASARSMLNQPDTRWASNYGPTPLRPPGTAQLNAPIGSGGLGNQDFQLLLSKQNQGGFSLATANAPPQQSPMAMRQALMNQMPSENMGALESLLMRQEEERVLMGNKRQRPSAGVDDDSRPKKFGASDYLGGMEATQGLTPEMIAANKNIMLQQQQIYEGSVAGSPKPRKRRAKTFPVKLMECLMAHYDERYVAWLPDGRSFVIIHPDNFIDHIISRTFKNSKYASFVRKLNRWGFARLTSGTGTDCFYHPLFQRDRLDLAAQMLCMPRNDSASAKKRAQMGIKPPTPITAADVPPQERPSLAGVEKFFPGGTEGAQKQQGDGDGGATESESEDDHGTTSPDNRKQPAAGNSSPEEAVAG